MCLTAALPAAADTLEGASEARCRDLAEQDFGALMEAPTQLMSSRVVPADGDLPAYCEIRGYVRPQVQFYLWLPLTNWTGRFVGIGCGGACGVIDRVASSTVWRPIVRRGDAAMFNDMGHVGRDTRDLHWAPHNLQAQVDYGFRATHVATVAGKAITERFHGRPVAHSYFVGNSTGGRQGLISAQRFPGDYDGIVAKCPAVSSRAGDTIIWTLQSLTDRAGRATVSAAQLRHVHAAVLDRCDADDGVRDGVLTDSEACDFDPDEVSCARQSHANCLSTSQVESVRRVYRGPPLDPAEATDAARRRGFTRGSELGWIGQYVSESGAPAPSWGFMMGWVRANEAVWAELTAGGGPVSLHDYQFPRHTQMRGTFQLLHDAWNPDLSAFAGRGGKLIMMQGTADPVIAPDMTDRFYEVATRAMGGIAPTQKFFRYFRMPGVGHCFSGDSAGADVFDGLADITRWVEEGIAPDQIEAFKLRRYTGIFPDAELPVDEENVVFSRPLFPHPLRARYSGRGNTAAASSYEPESSH